MRRDSPHQRECAKDPGARPVRSYFGKTQNADQKAHGSPRSGRQDSKSLRYSYSIPETCEGDVRAFLLSTHRMPIAPNAVTQGPRNDFIGKDLLVDGEQSPLAQGIQFSQETLVHGGEIGALDRIPENECSPKDAKRSHDDLERLRGLCDAFGSCCHSFRIVSRVGRLIDAEVGMTLTVEYKLRVQRSKLSAPTKSTRENFTCRKNNDIPLDQLVCAHRVLLSYQIVKVPKNRDPTVACGGQAAKDHFRALIT